MAQDDYFDGEDSYGAHPARHATPISLNEAALKLVEELPVDVRPAQTATRFPHILNRFAQLWQSPKLIDRYFDSLLMDQRGGRQGFPLSILTELQTLKEYYFTKVQPKAATKWDDVFVFSAKDHK